jgi:2-phospho-L-lactate guanylyltransferase
MPGVAAAVVIPVKSFRAAKARLSPVLDPDQRVELARWSAERVVAAAGDLPVYVACDDEEVADWAGDHGASVLWHPGIGLNAAVSRSVADLGAVGVESVIVCHADLARPEPLSRLAGSTGITLVPDRARDGTNVAVVPAGASFEFAYGPASFRRHLRTAVAAGLPVHVVADPLLALDIDTPADLAHPLVQEVLPAWLRTSPDSRA